jgi:serine/threonine protein kinase
MGRFTLAEALGHGGFAHVYRAVDDDGSEVALKVLTGLHDDARDRFAQEAHLLERLDGRGFPRFVESGLDADQPWFAIGCRRRADSETTRPSPPRGDRRSGGFGEVDDC